jgi:hypothetical protein
MTPDRNIPDLHAGVFLSVLSRVIRRSSFAEASADSCLLIVF